MIKNSLFFRLVSTHKILFISFLMSITPFFTYSQHAQFDAKIDSLLRIMTPEEKAGQLSLFTNDLNPTGDFIQDHYIQLIEKGLAGGIFNAHGAKYTRKLQEIAVTKSRLGIPLLFAFDVIHGHHTIFPIPLAEAASWDLDAIERSARIAAIESSATGLHWVFAPMCDISRDPRWGRVMEGAGEDTYLASLIAAARVKGFQGDGFADADAVAACVKHFAAYGAPQAGREYHTVDMSELTLHEVYLPPYKAAIDAGALTVMSGFNELNGVPATANPYLLKKILRDEWKFDGFVVSDFTSVMELMFHGVAADTAQATLLALEAGTDMDMQASFYLKSVPYLLKNKMLDPQVLDESVRKVLQLKFQLGLFDDPYRFCSESREKEIVMKDEFLEASLDMAKKSMVLLKNDGNLLPLRKDIEKIAVIGPLANSKQDMIGGWSAAGNPKDAESLLDGLKKVIQSEKLMYSPGCKVNDMDTSGFKEAVELAAKADVVVLALGEPAWMTGEATSRTNLDLPGVQNELAKAIFETGTPVVVVLFNGRPLTINWLNDNIPAILEAWFPGTKAGTAITEVLFGDYNPSGKLPMTFPKSVGQIPVHYNMKNTGRPYDGFTNTTSRYTDSPNEPLFCFGHGLSYTSFEYSEITLDKSVMNDNEAINCSVKVKNTGKYEGEEIVQLYIRDKVASITRPVKELKGFQKINLQPGASTTVSFKIDKSLLSFYNSDLQYDTEAGEFEIMVGTSSDLVKSASIRLIK